MKKIFIKYHEMLKVFSDILRKHGMDERKAELIAKIFTDNSLDGVYSHGVNRFEGFIQDILKGYIKIDHEPELISSTGAMQQWNGNLAPGPYIASELTKKSVQLAKKHGIGCIGVANSNHWMRGGYYGWQAAASNCTFIAWTNTIANMPAWGAIDCKLGNNPIVFAAPFNNSAIVLDMAMSQFSYGLMKNYRLEGKDLPVHGGYDKNGELTRDPEKILRSERPVPSGYWKGAGMALLLDIIATILSGGLSTSEITKNNHEYSCSQVFVSIDLEKLHNNALINQTIENIVMDYKNSKPENNNQITYPGERVLQTRKENREKGIPVNVDIWTKIMSL